MPVVRTLVVLANYGDQSTIHRPRDAAWYDDYFFNPFYGQKAYWLKQSDNNIVLTGQVIDWRFYPFGSFNLGNLGEAGNAVIAEVRTLLNPQLSQFDLPIVVFGQRPPSRVNGRAVRIVMDPPREVTGFVCGTEVSFDGVSHEIGHAIGLCHSFGKDGKPVSEEHSGGYGHPHCIMSAQFYGGYPHAGSFHPSNPRDGRPEYDGLGPGLNAATALARGWVDAHIVTGSMPHNYRIRSRNDGGRDPNRIPQALLIESFQTLSTYVVELRENLDWDRGQDRPYVIVTEDKGGLADGAYPNQSGGTFQARLGLPLNPAAKSEHWLEVRDIAIHVLEVDLVGRHVLVRVYPTGAPSLNLTTTTTETYKSQPVFSDLLSVEEGEHRFERGQVRCVEGVWAYKKRRRTPQVVFEAHWQSSEAVEARWTVWGEPAPANGAFLKHLPVRIPTPQLVNFTNEADVEIHCQVTPLVNGSRLTVTSNYEFVFTLRVGILAASASTIANEEFQVNMAGLVYDYGWEFEQRRLRCLGRFIKSHPTYEVEIDFDAWRDIPRPKHHEAQLLLKLLAGLHEDGRADEYKQMTAELAALAGREEIGLSIVALDDRLDTTEIAKRPLPGCTFPPRKGDA